MYLFRRHVGGRAHDHVCSRESACAFIFRGAGQAKVRDLGPPIFRHQNIGRFDVAVNDPLSVGIVQRFANLDRKLQCLAGGQRARADEAREIGPIDKLHDDVRMAVRSQPEVVDGDDARMLEPTEDLGLTLEAGEEIFLGHQFRRQQFDGDGTVQRRLNSFVNRAHPSVPDEPLDAVLRQQLREDLWSRRSPHPRIARGRLSGFQGACQQVGGVDSLQFLIWIVWSVHGVEWLLQRDYRIKKDRLHSSR